MLNVRMHIRILQFLHRLRQWLPVLLHLPQQRVHLSLLLKIAQQLINVHSFHLSNQSDLTLGIPVKQFLPQQFLVKEGTQDLAFSLESLCNFFIGLGQLGLDALANLGQLVVDTLLVVEQREGGLVGKCFNFIFEFVLGLFFAA